MYLETIREPADIRSLDVRQLEALAEEIRGALLRKLSAVGGHVGPSLGTVELELAMHYVFDSPEDRFVFDVSHQSHVHKILTGRREAFTDPAHYNDVSGFASPAESPHDPFYVGHTSTSVSLAGGIAHARDLRGGTGYVVAVIGDGSLSGGEAYEGLNAATETGGRFIIIVNDNGMSIAPVHGGYAENLRKLRESGGTAGDNLFRALGFRYLFEKEGNDVGAVIRVLGEAKKEDRPTVVHLCTLKGKGYAPAEKDPETYHWTGVFDPEKGITPGAGNGYEALTAAFLEEEIRKHPETAVITSGTTGGCGFTPEIRKRLGKNYIDVGICEQEAVSLVSAMALSGARPVYCVFSSFLTRASDQVWQDLCMNRSPAVLLVFNASVYGPNAMTHAGFYDMPLLSNVPGLVYLAPAHAEEYLAMLQWALGQREHPVAIRVPAVKPVYTGEEDLTDYGCINRYKVLRSGKGAAILALGTFLEIGKRTADLMEKKGLTPTLIEPRYANGIDEGLLKELESDHELVVTLEDGILSGGFGEKIAAFYGTSPVKVKSYGIRKTFYDRFRADDVLCENRITPEMITEDVLCLLRKGQA